LTIETLLLGGAKVSCQMPFTTNINVVYSALGAAACVYKGHVSELALAILVGMQ